MIDCWIGRWWMDDKQVDRERERWQRYKDDRQVGRWRPTYTGLEVYLSTHPTIYILRFTLETLYDWASGKRDVSQAGWKFRTSVLQTWDWMPFTLGKLSVSFHGLQGMGWGPRSLQREVFSKSTDGPCSSHLQETFTATPSLVSDQTSGHCSLANWRHTKNFMVTLTQHDHLPGADMPLVSKRRDLPRLRLFGGQRLDKSVLAQVGPQVA